MLFRSVFNFAVSVVLLMVFSRMNGFMDCWINWVALVASSQKSIHPKIHQSICLLVAARPRVTKNPQPLPAVGFVKLLRSTSAAGVANYDDYQNDSLTDVFQHCGHNLLSVPCPVKFECVKAPAKFNAHNNWPARPPPAQG